MWSVSTSSILLASFPTFKTNYSFEISDRSKNNTVQEFTENLVAFVKILSLYNVMNSLGTGRYSLQFETNFEMGRIAMSFLKNDPGEYMLIDVLRYEKKECAERIT